MGSIRSTATAVVLAVLVVFTTTGAVAGASVHGAPADEPTVPAEASPDETGIATPPPVAYQAAASATYHFGTQPLAQVVAAAEAREDDGCAISAEGVAALMLAPTFPETGAGSSAAPSPMTLSRWDTDTGLHSLSDPDRYARAFWHPGVGMWQFDSAGGWGLTAYQRMDMRQISGVAAEVMTTRYCNAKNAGQSDTAARNAAWSPWHACRNGTCHSIFASIYRGRDQALAIEKVAGIDVTGGVVVRSCTPPGMTARTCHHVDPAAAQGYTGWRGSPAGTSSIAPLSHPFDVVEVGNREWRLWSSSDTGYGVDIAASRPLGANARAKPDPDLPCARVSPLEWYVDGVRVDSVDRSGCSGTSPAPPFDQTTLHVSGTYETVIGDFDGDALDDIVWYRPGAGSDYLWRSPVTGGSSRAVQINGTYEPLVGDFDGDGFDDIFWYGSGAAPDALWAGRSGSNPFRDVPAAGMQVNGVYSPVVADFDGNGTDDIFWFDEASPHNYLWKGSSGPKFASGQRTLALDVIDAVGDFDGDGKADLVGHRAGPDPDSFYFSTGTGFVRHDRAVNGAYSLTVGDFDGNGTDDIHWYADNGGNDSIWFHDVGQRASSPAGASAQVAPGMRATVVPHTRDEVLWVGPESVADQYWTFSGRALSRSTSVFVADGYQLLTGRWTAAGHGVLAYAPGSAVDALWTR